MDGGQSLRVTWGGGQRTGDDIRDRVVYVLMDKHGERISENAHNGTSTSPFFCPGKVCCGIAAQLVLGRLVVEVPSDCQSATNLVHCRL